MKITDDIKYVGVNDRIIDLFEGQFPVPEGMKYNSYLIADEKTAVIDSVDRRFTDEWLNNIDKVLQGKTPNYLIIQHMEPDHSSGITAFATKYPEAVIVSSSRAFTMMLQYFGTDYTDKRIVVGEKDTLTLGRHTLSFISAPMVHWPEVIMTYDSLNKILFSADAFGKFGTDESVENWDDEARRYYFGIVGKYGAQVQAVLKKLKDADVKIICSLHGPVLSGNISHYIGLYDIWSRYESEDKGVVIAYTSVYGHTKDAVKLLSDALKAKGVTNVITIDLARNNIYKAVEHAFRYDKVVFATTTYNGTIFPFMRDFISALTERGFQKKVVGFIENGSWAPAATRIMKQMLECCKNIDYTEATVKIMSALTDENRNSISALAAELAK